jgi:hypothetical protein
MIGFALSADIDENYVSVAWTSGLSFFFSFQILGREIIPQVQPNFANNIATSGKGVQFCHGLGLVIAFCLFIMYAIGHSVGACIFSIFLDVSLALTLFVILNANKKELQEPTKSKNVKLLG